MWKMTMTALCLRRELSFINRKNIFLVLFQCVFNRIVRYHFFFEYVSTCLR